MNDYIVNAVNNGFLTVIVHVKTIFKFVKKEVSSGQLWEPSKHST